MPRFYLGLKTLSNYQSQVDLCHHMYLFDVEGNLEQVHMTSGEVKLTSVQILNGSEFSM